MSHPTTPALERAARRRVALKFSVLMHALVFTLVNLGLWLGVPRAPVPLWGWALGLAIHATVVTFLLTVGDGLRGRMLAHEREVLRRRDAQ